MRQTSFRDRRGDEVPVGRTAVQELRDSLPDGSSAPGDADYEESRAIWNGMIDRRPALIARCSSAGDVARCIAFAREHGIALTVRGGGHNIGGRALADGALVVDLSKRRGVAVDADARTATVEPGATLADVDAATAAHGLVLPSGIVSETGIAGLTLGGGFGWLSRRFGLTADHLREAEVVSGDGEILRVAEGNGHDDLLWALRGGGGGGGIVTSFDYHLRPAGPRMTCGMVVRRGDEAETSARRFREHAAEASEDLTLLLVLRNAPPAPFLPEAIHGEPIAGIAMCHCGETEVAAEEVAPLRQFGDPVADLVDVKPFVEHQQMFDPLEPAGWRYYWKSEYIDTLDDPMLEMLLGHAEHCPSPHSAILVFHLGGEVARVPSDATAAAHRDARFIVNIAGAWEDAADDEENIAWVRSLWERVHRRSRRGGYVNFLTEDAGREEWSASRGGVDIGRLQRIRRRYDSSGILGGEPATT